MKVLWFSNTPASGVDVLNISALGGGWLSALDKLLGSKVELHIAFYYPKYKESFKHNNVFYHPICNKNWKLAFLKQKLFGNFIDKEDLQIYINLINKINPNLIHIHGTENAFGAIIDSTEIPVVISVQGNITVIYHKFLSGINKHLLKVKKIKYESILDYPFFISFLGTFRSFKKMKQREINNLKHCKHIIGRTDWDRRITRILAPQSNYFHGNEILKNGFYNTIWKPKSRDKIIIHTTNGNSPFKGFETLCYALHLLNELGVGIEWRVAGISESDLIVKVIKKQLGKYYPKKGLLLMGGVHESQLIEKLLEADIYVMPSHIENSPNNLCEAMILGMPCIATFAGGTGSMLKDGEEGILIQDGDPWAMAGAILEMKNNPEKAKMYGQAARVRALKRHDKKRIVKKLLKVYESIIQENLN